MAFKNCGFRSVMPDTCIYKCKVTSLNLLIFPDLKLPFKKKHEVNLESEKNYFNFLWNSMSMIPEDVGQWICHTMSWYVLVRLFWSTHFVNIHQIIWFCLHGLPITCVKYIATCLYPYQLHVSTFTVYNFSQFGALIEKNKIIFILKIG